MNSFKSKGNILLFWKYQLINCGQKHVLGNSKNWSYVFFKEKKKNAQNIQIVAHPTCQQRKWKIIF